MKTKKKLIVSAILLLLGIGICFLPAIIKINGYFIPIAGTVLCFIATQQIISVIVACDTTKNKK